MADEKILSSENGGKSFEEKKVITGQVDGLPSIINEKMPDSLSERIRISTNKGGLVSLPVGFDNQEGDWKCINSTNPFEILYLDYKQYKFITSEIVKSNFMLLEAFWRDKVAIMNSGGNRVAFKNKYGEGTIENSLSKIKRSFEKLSTQDGIDQYFLEINNQRLKKGAESLKESIEDMLVDDVVERAEIELRLERGVKYDLTEEEILNLIKVAINKNNLKPFGQVKGSTLKENLLSVSWMSDEKIEKQLKIEEEKKKSGREIFDNIRAYSIEEIGLILFNNEGLAKEYIREGLIINSIDYFSSSKAKQILDITKEKKEEHLKYLQIIYRLNPKLPYKFNNSSYPRFKEITKAFFDNPKMGKEHLKQGNLGIWLLETQKESYDILEKIGHTANNLDLAFLELLYTFNPELPYRFILYTSNSKLPYKDVLVKTPLELCTEIDKNKDGWNAGKRELFNSSISVWLRNTGKMTISEKWDEVKNQFSENKDIGLEFFLHLLNDKLAYASTEINVKVFSFPKIQSGERILSCFIISNKTRGHIEGNIIFSKLINGVSLSSKKFTINVAEGNPIHKVDLVIDSKNLLKGVDYKTDIQISTTDNKKMSIPISFRIVFPKNAFISALLKYTLLFAFFGLILRGIIYAFGFHDWLNAKYNFYLHPFDISWQAKPYIYYFPIILLLFILLVFTFSSFWNIIKRTLNLK